MSRVSHFKLTVPQKLRQGTVIVFFFISALLVPSGLTQSSQIMFASEPPTKLSEAEIDRQLKSLPDWTIEDQQLRRTYRFKNFVEAVAFVNRLVEPAESAGHHPDIFIAYNQVAIALTTHDAGGITQKDFDLAQTISQVAAETLLN